MWPDVVTQHAQWSNVVEADPLALTAASRLAKERPHAGIRASFPKWSRESPWLALNRCISREGWTGPTPSWMAQQRSLKPRTQLKEKCYVCRQLTDPPQPRHT